MRRQGGCSEWQKSYAKHSAFAMTETSARITNKGWLPRVQPWERLHLPAAWADGRAMTLEQAIEYALAPDVQ